MLQSSKKWSNGADNTIFYFIIFYSNNTVMPIKGQVSLNPTNGDRFEYLETAGDTKGERLVVKATIKGKGQYAPHHIHVFQDELFEVVSGKLMIWLDGETKVLTAGEKILLPKSIPHNHYNNEDIPVTYIHTVTPAYDFEYLIENLTGLAADGKGKNGKYGLVQELVTLKYLDSKTYLANMPVGIQNILSDVIGPVGRMFGYRAIYRKYSGFDK